MLIGKGWYEISYRVNQLLYDDWLSKFYVAEVGRS